MMNRHTGQRLDALAHLRQSIGDILATPIGSRVMRREYGSLVPELIDHPDNIATQVRVYAAVASALMRWEPRFRLTRIESLREADRPGAVLFRRYELTRSWANEGRLDLERVRKPDREKAIQVLNTCLGSALAQFALSGAQKAKP